MFWGSSGDTLCHFSRLCFFFILCCGKLPSRCASFSGFHVAQCGHALSLLLTWASLGHIALTLFTLSCLLSLYHSLNLCFYEAQAFHILRASFSDFFHGTECLCFVMHSLLSLLCRALLSHFGRLILCVFFGVAHCSHPLSFLLLCASFSGLCETDVTLSIDDFPTTVTLLFCASFSGTLLLYSSCVSRSGFCVAHSCFTLPPSYRAFHFHFFLCITLQSHCHLIILCFSPPPQDFHVVRYCHSVLIFQT